MGDYWGDAEIKGTATTVLPLISYKPKASPFYAKFGQELPILTRFYWPVPLDGGLAVRAQKFKLTIK
jgi:hypothetical protein